MKPRVTARSKGIASYKGVFTSVTEAEQSKKTICLIPSRDGRVFEMRKSFIGECITPKEKILDFEEHRAGFTPALPKIPKDLMDSVIVFFRYYLTAYEVAVEALADVYWDKEKCRYFVHIPKQKVTEHTVTTENEDTHFEDSRYIHVAEIHSHNKMNAIFSSDDDRDEQASRIYIVIGRLHKYYPKISARVCNGGTFLPIKPGLVLEQHKDFPEEWLESMSMGPPRVSDGTERRECYEVL